MLLSFLGVPASRNLVSWSSNTSAESVGNQFVGSLLKSLEPGEHGQDAAMDSGIVLSGVIYCTVQDVHVVFARLGAHTFAVRSSTNL